MKKGIYILILFIGHSIFSQKKVDLLPVIKKQAVSIISGSQHYYYPLSENKTVDFSVKGFDKLVIYSRELITNKPSGYRISYNFDLDTQSNVVTYEVNKSRKDYRSVFSDKTINKSISLYQKKTITVPNKATKISINSKNAIIKIIAYKGKQKENIKANNPTKSVQFIRGKSLKYYKLNSKTPTLIETNKEGELVIYTRQRMTNSISPSYYTFSYKMQDTTRIVTIDKVVKSTHTAYSSLNIKETPSTYNKTVLKIRDVYQKILFSSNFDVDARFVFKKTVRKNGWEEIESKNGEIVPLVVKKKKIVREYTRIEPGKPFQFTVNNNEEIKIFIRGEFRYDMHANNDYEIVLKDNNKIVNTYKLSCHRSNVMQYKHNNVLIPGTLDKFSISAPKGKHAYAISINNVDKTALIRVLRKEVVAD